MFRAKSPIFFLGGLGVDPPNSEEDERERVGQIERQDALVSKASADPPVVATDGGAQALILCWTEFHYSGRL